MFTMFFDPNGAFLLFVVLQYCYSHAIAINSDSITQVFLTLLIRAAAP
jgi:hypothetical protein